MLHLACGGGLRVSELVALKLADLTLHPQPSIQVMGKGRRERILPFGNETASTIRDWLEIRGKLRRSASKGAIPRITLPEIVQSWAFGLRKPMNEHPLVEKALLSLSF